MSLIIKIFEFVINCNLYNFMISWIYIYSRFIFIVDYFDILGYRYRMRFFCLE